MKNWGPSQVTAQLAVRLQMAPDGTQTPQAPLTLEPPLTPGRPCHWKSVVDSQLGPLTSHGHVPQVRLQSQHRCCFLLPEVLENGFPRQHK